MKRTIRVWICFCFLMVLLFSNRSIAQAAEKNTAKIYYVRLQKLEKKEKKLNKKVVITWDMNNASSKIYKMWDDELNAVYKGLKLKLLKKKFEKLQQEQRKWITYKEAEMEKVSQECAGGTGERAIVLNKAYYK